MREVNRLIGQFSFDNDAAAFDVFVVVVVVMVVKGYVLVKRFGMGETIAKEYTGIHTRVRSSLLLFLFRPRKVIFCHFIKIVHK